MVCLALQQRRPNVIIKFVPPPRLPGECEGILVLHADQPKPCTGLMGSAAKPVRVYILHLAPENADPTS
jgi:hypothetical protein